MASLRKVLHKSSNTSCLRVQRWIRLYTTEGPHVQPPQPGKFKKYIYGVYLKNLEWTEGHVEKRYPKVFKIYKVFKVGTGEFISDTKTYFSVSKQIWSGRELGTFTRKELEIYRQMPESLWTVGPVLAIAALPFANYVVFPIAYLFPRQFLSQHFWSEEQKAQFALYYHKQRVDQHKPILKALISKTKKIKDKDSRQKIEDILKKIKAKSHPSVEEILSAANAFQQPPLQLDRVSRPYMLHLAKGLRLHSLVRSRLLQDAVLLNYIDRAMKAEGIDTLSDQDLRDACFTRGLNSSQLNREDMLHYLTQWTTISMDIDERNISLLLHNPILLAYNHPDNRAMRKHSPDR